MHPKLQFEGQGQQKLLIDAYNSLPLKKMNFGVLEDLGKKRQKILFKIEEE